MKIKTPFSNSLVMTYEQRGRLYTYFAANATEDRITTLCNAYLDEDDEAMKKHLLKCLNQALGAHSLEDLINKLNHWNQKKSITFEMLKGDWEWRLPR